MPRDFEWVNANIIRRIIDKFKLQSTPINIAEDWKLSKVINPSTDIDKVLRTLELKTYTRAVAGTGLLTMAQVPSGKRWLVYGARFYLSTGTWTVDSINVYDGADYIPVKALASGTDVLYGAGDGKPLELDQLWILSAYIDSFTGAGNGVAQVLYTEEYRY